MASTVTVRLREDIRTKAGLAFAQGDVVEAVYTPRSVITNVPAHYTAFARTGYRTAFPATCARPVAGADANA